MLQNVISVWLICCFFLVAAGNMRHLIVEACISRNLLDTSVYFWPGYVNALSSQVPHSASNQVVGWSSFMKGSPLTPSMVNALVATPASRYALIVFVCIM
uniref:Secreted protein n=1 Tax=Cucumis sativus TaxID=3659 RepID=A0A0A0KG85_CUCSA